MGTFNLYGQPELPETANYWSIMLKDRDSCVGNTWPYAYYRSDHLKLTIQTGYDFCCGLREFGEVYIFGDIEKGREELIKDLQRYQDIFRFIGALTYTQVRDSRGNSYSGESVDEFIETWPEASCGSWFFNPNSGNTVRIWTLPITEIKNYRWAEDEDEE